MVDYDTWKTTDPNEEDPNDWECHNCGHGIQYCECDEPVWVKIDYNEPDEPCDDDYGDVCDKYYDGY